MYTAPFRYFRPSSVAEAEKMFGACTDARYLAGGQSLIPAMKQRLASPSELIDIARIPALCFIRTAPGALVIGAGTRHASVAASREVHDCIPALAVLAGLIGDPAVRHRGTLGGSIANNDPAADYPAALVALDAGVLTNRRKITAEQFFTGMFDTVLEAGEIVTEIAFRVPRRAAYVKFPNPASRYAMPGVFVADFGDEIRVAVTGAASCVFRAQQIESALSRQFAPKALADIEIDPDGLTSDIFASAQYRAHLIRVMAQRAVSAL
jgi:carbon-monoxide dehydrogenase medium subunit